MTAEPSMFLMANLGSEVTRLLCALAEHNEGRVRGAHTRACAILTEIRALPDAEHAEGEFSILQEVLDDLIREAPHLRIQPESLRNYFTPFALKVLASSSYGGGNSNVLELIPKPYRNPKIRGIRGKNGADEGGVPRYSDRG